MFKQFNAQQLVNLKRTAQGKDLKKMMNVMQ